MEWTILLMMYFNETKRVSVALLIEAIQLSMVTSKGNTLLLNLKVKSVVRVGWPKLDLCRGWWQMGVSRGKALETNKIVILKTFYLILYVGSALCLTCVFTVSFTYSIISVYLRCFAYKNINSFSFYMKSTHTHTHTLKFFKSINISVMLDVLIII